MQTTCGRHIFSNVRTQHGVFLVRVVLAKHRTSLHHLLTPPLLPTANECIFLGFVAEVGAAFDVVL